MWIGIGAVAALAAAALGAILLRRADADRTPVPVEERELERVERRLEELAGREKPGR